MPEVCHLNIYVFDRLLSQPVLASRLTGFDPSFYSGNFDSSSPSISADGRYVAFASAANNLVLSDTNHGVDTFVRDSVAGTTTRVSVASDGTQAFGGIPAISADGHYVAFWSYANNLVVSDTNGVGDIFRHDLPTGQTIRVSVASDGTQSNDTSNLPAISGDGSVVAFESEGSNLVANDTNGFSDVFVYDSGGVTLLTQKLYLPLIIR